MASTAPGARDGIFRVKTCSRVERLVVMALEPTVGQSYVLTWTGLHACTSGVRHFPSFPRQSAQLVCQTK